MIKLGGLVSRNPFKPKEIVKEGTDLYNKNGIQLTKSSAGNGMILQINYGGKYITIPQDKLKEFTSAMNNVYKHFK